MIPDKTSYYISSGYANINVLEFLIRHNLGKKNIYKLFTDQAIFLNNVLAKREDIIKKDDVIDIYYNENIDFNCDMNKLEIVYEDDYLLIVNKPKNMIIHPEFKTGNNTLINLVAGYFSKKNIKRNVRFANRLDFETTGLVIFTKDILTECYMDKIVENHTLKKYYYAIVENDVIESNGKIETYIAKDRHTNNKRRVSDSGSKSITEFKVIKKVNRHTLLECELMTGKTHQIRVHLSNMGNPIAGDELYGGKKDKIDRVALHAYKIIFKHPYTEKNMSISKEMPSDMKKIINLGE